MEEEDFFEKMGGFLSRKARNIRDRFTLDETDLIRAVGKNDVEGTRRVLDAGVDPDIADIIGRRALTMAVDSNNDVIVDLLLKAGANPNLKGKNGDSPLIKAIFWENPKIIELLMEAGADPQIVGSKGKTALQDVKETGVEKLITLVENFNKLRKQKNIEQDKALHERQKAQAEKARKSKEIAEEKAREEAQKNVQKEALQKYPEAAVDPNRGLIRAIKNNDDEAVAIFILKTEDLNVWDEELKNAPFLAAVKSKNSMAIGLLIDRGADPLKIYAENQHSAFSMAIQKRAYGLIAKIFELYPEKTKQLLNDPTQEISPQFLAYRDPKLLNLLIKGGADPYYGGVSGQSPVVKAIAKGGLGILPVLSRHGIDLSKEVEGKNLMEWSIFYNRLDWVNGLKAEGVEISQKEVDYAEKLGGRDEILEELKSSL